MHLHTYKLLHDFPAHMHFCPSPLCWAVPKPWSSEELQLFRSMLLHLVACCCWQCSRQLNKAICTNFMFMQPEQIALANPPNRKPSVFSYVLITSVLKLCFQMMKYMITFCLDKVCNVLMMYWTVTTALSMVTYFHKSSKCTRASFLYGWVWGL